MTNLGRQPEVGDNSDDERDEVCITVFRDLLSRAQPGETCFLSGRQHDGKWIDLPETLIERIRTDFPAVRKASAISQDAGERDPATRRRIDFVRDPETGRPASIYFVLVESLSPTHAEVIAGRFGGTANGAGYRYIVRKRDSAWVVQSRKWLWVS